MTCFLFRDGDLSIKVAVIDVEQLPPVDTVIRLHTPVGEQHFVVTRVLLVTRSLEMEKLEQIEASGNSYERLAEWLIEVEPVQIAAPEHGANS